MMSPVAPSVYDPFKKRPRNYPPRLKKLEAIRALGSYSDDESAALDPIEATDPLVIRMPDGVSLYYSPETIDDMKALAKSSPWAIHMVKYNSQNIRMVDYGDRYQIQSLGFDLGDIFKPLEDIGKAIIKPIGSIIKNIGPIAAVALPIAGVVTGNPALLAVGGAFTAMQQSQAQQKAQQQQQAQMQAQVAQVQAQAQAQAQAQVAQIQAQQMAQGYGLPQIIQQTPQLVQSAYPTNYSSAYQAPYPSSYAPIGLPTLPDYQSSLNQSQPQQTTITTTWIPGIPNNYVLYGGIGLGFLTLVLLLRRND